MTAALSLAGFIVFAALGFGVRTFVHLRRTGSTGFRGFSGRPGSAEHTGGLLFALALLLAIAAPIAQLNGWIHPMALLDRLSLQILGFALYAIGLAATLGAQLTMGDSWRIGVDPGERTALVTTGAFRWMRNPIFSAMLVCSLGLILLAPNPLAFVGFAVLCAGLELQVRKVEEPYLLQAHGAAYRTYAARVGRFVPFVGRLR